MLLWFDISVIIATIMPSIEFTQCDREKRKDTVHMGISGRHDSKSPNNAVFTSF